MSVFYMYKRKKSEREEEKEKERGFYTKKIGPPSPS
jgi:hypothetical protein